VIGAADGSGLPPDEHARAFVARLGLTPAQAASLAAELRNALVPARDDAERRGAGRAIAGIDRALDLVAEMVRGIP
jgi:hypothetical protein